MTIIQLCKHGDAAYVPDGVARLLPAVLRTQEPPDRDFALVSKRCLTYLKYVVFPRRCQGVVLEGVLAGLRDPQWHARAASLKFAQAFAFRHAFALTRDETTTLRDEVAARLTDAQIEVRTLASATLVGFLRGAGAADGAADALRARFLAAAKTPPPKRRRGDGDGGGTNGADATRAHHGAVLGVAAASSRVRTTCRSGCRNTRDPRAVGGAVEPGEGDCAARVRGVQEDTPGHVGRDEGGVHLGTVGERLRSDGTLRPVPSREHILYQGKGRRGRGGKGRKGRGKERERDGEREGERARPEEETRRVPRRGRQR